MLRNIFIIMFSLLAFGNVAMAQQNIVVVLDDSGSMSGSRMDDAKSALSEVIAVLPSDTQVAVYALNAGWVYPDAQGTMKRIDRASAVKSINEVYPSGGTPLGRSIKLALTHCFLCEIAITTERIDYW